MGLHIYYLYFYIAKLTWLSSIHAYLHVGLLFILFQLLSTPQFAINGRVNALFRQMLLQIAQFASPLAFFLKARATICRALKVEINEK
jgi:hypothetical protein